MSSAMGENSSAAAFVTRDLLDYPLDRGRVLVEAAAGSGKTYTIQILFLRLILERPDLGVGNILVVTFTEAATEELKGRIREVLLEASQRLAALGAGNKDLERRVPENDLDRVLLNCLQKGIPARLLAGRLKAARAGFDEVVIATIHGFCNRVLEDYAFEAGVRSRVELLKEGTWFCRLTAEDYWRRFFYRPETPLTRQAAASDVTVATLAELAAEYERRPDLVFLPETPDGDSFRKDLEVATAALEEIERSWHQGCVEGVKFIEDPGREHYRKLLLDGDWLKSWPGKKFDLWFSTLAGLLRSGSWPAGKDEEEALERFTREKLRKCTKVRKSRPEDAFFDCCQELYELAARRRESVTRLALLFKRDFLEFATGPEGLVRIKAQLRRRGYSDFLTELKAVLNGPSGDAVRQRIGERWRVALIDEFQDTDPVQYEIFSLLFGRSGQLFYRIGDPKQSIYAFRGADIFAYLAAAREPGQERLTLDRNFRSTPELLAAVNRIFAVERPFFYEEIAYRPVLPGRRPRARLRFRGEALTPLAIWRLTGPDGRLNKPDAIRTGVEELAKTCRRLLREGEIVDEESGRCRPLAASDIAVLTRTNREIAQVMEACRLHQVPVSLKVGGSLWETPEAAELLLLLEAILNPENDRLLRTALATRLLGREIRWLDEVRAARAENLPTEGENSSPVLRRYEAWRQACSRARDSWAGIGFVAMLARFPDFSGITPDPEPGFALDINLARGPRGERALTNFYHLQEVLHEAEREFALGPRALVDWFCRRRAEVEGEENEYELRLEGEAEALSVMTVHKSKGLEFPVVFAPFLWSRALQSGARKANHLAFHRREKDGSFRHCLNLEEKPAAEIRRAAACEELAEQLRLVYVALTRAQSNLFVFWPETRDSHKTALMYLRRPPAGEAGLDAFCGGPGARSAKPSFADEEAEKWEESPEIVLHDEGFGLAGRLPAGDGRGEKAASPDRTTPVPSTTGAREFKRSLPPASGFVSFSRLAGPGEPLPAAAEKEREEVFAEAEEAAAVPVADAVAAPSPLLLLPGGTAAGNAIHEIFENLDFTALAGGGDESACRALTELVASSLRRWRVAGAAEPAPEVLAGVVEMVLRALNTPLPGAVGDPPVLARLEPADLAREMEFWLPLRDDFKAGRLRDWGRKVVGKDWRLENFTGLPRRGFLNGFIDLVFNAGGRFFLLDWKTNNLGPDCADYTPDKLEREMTRHHYQLQYQLYLLALHRYLRQRLAGYDFSAHFGGVFYLFVRGLNGLDGGSGVYFRRPGLEEVEELEEIICGARP